MSIFERALHIPAEQLLFEPPRARHERVLLPLVARPAPRFHGAIALAAFAALACLVMATEMGLRADDGGLVFALGFLAAAVVPAGIALTGLRDALPATTLSVDAEGLRDSRLCLGRIAWPEVAAAELVATGSGIAAVRLTLRHDGPPRGNPFRIGGWSVDWAGRRRVRTIALMLLDVRAHALAHAILILAARHGATTDPPSPGRLDPPG